MTVILEVSLSRTIDKMNKLANMPLFKYVNFFFLSPILLFALFTTLWMCEPNGNILLKVTPRFLSSSQGFYLSNIVWTIFCSVSTMDKKIPVLLVAISLFVPGKCQTKFIQRAETWIIHSMHLQIPPQRHVCKYQILYTAPTEQVNQEERQDLANVFATLSHGPTVEGTTLLLQFSFLPRTIVDWNSRPTEIAKVQGLLAVPAKIKLQTDWILETAQTQLFKSWSYQSRVAPRERTSFGAMSVRIIWCLICNSQQTYANWSDIDYYYFLFEKEKKKEKEKEE